MAVIPIPVTKTLIASAAWGIPLTNQVNTNTTDIAALKPTAWIKPTLSNGWTDKTTTGFVAYRKVGDMVQIRGYVGGGTASTAIYVLPVGYRPPYSVSVASVSYAVSGLWGSAKLDINTDGSIVMSSLSQASTREYLNLECQFSITP